MIKVTFLGTGTSHGIPVIGCPCERCHSSDPKDNRYRSSVLIEKDGTSIVIDTGYEFRLQCLRAGITHLDGVLYTHDHSDHLVGLDDLRVFCKTAHLPVYSIKSEMDLIVKKFDYAFADSQYDGIPKLDAKYAKPYEHFKIGELDIMAIPVMHGKKLIAGYRIENMAYITDVSNIQMNENAEYLKDLELLIIGALREEPHPTHYSFSQSLDAARKLKAKRVYFTHINHSQFNSYIENTYGPKGALPAYDGLVLEV